MEKLQRTRLQATALLAITLLVGALVGVAGQRAFSARQPTNAPRPEVDERQDRRDERGGWQRSILLDPKVLDQLGVTQEQRARIEQILQHREQQNKVLWDGFRPRLDTLMNQSRRDLWDQLTKEQSEQLDQIIKERRQRWREQHRQDSPDGRPRTGSDKKPTEKNNP